MGIFLFTADHSPPSSAEVKEWVELYLHSPNMPPWRNVQLKHGDFTYLPTYLSTYRGVQAGSGAHPASYPMGTKDSFLGGKAAGEWICLLLLVLRSRKRGDIPPLPNTPSWRVAQLLLPLPYFVVLQIISRCLSVCLLDSRLFHVVVSDTIAI
jgi:hypothetical protein